MKPELLPTLALGLVLGLEHALDADHVVAVSTMVSQYRSLRRSSLVGIVWGLGHSTTLFLVGLAVILFKVSIPDRVALGMEFAVGAVLVILGVSVVKSYYGRHVHAHPHWHGGDRHSHFHAHAGGLAHDHDHATSQPRQWLLVGMVHGLAGSAALMLLVLATIQTAALGLLYILVFGAGSILGMLGVSTLVGLPFVFTVQRSAALHRTLRVAVGGASLLYGVWIMLHVGLSQGLFPF